MNYAIEGISADVKAFSEMVLNKVQTSMFGVDRIIRLTMVALYTDGHVLLEGNPGLGKTELVKTIGKVLSLEFGRIQFTPDLMPSDITGTYMPSYSEKNEIKLAFQPGPIFTSLLLADEINRATPKTQSAMLEAMAENQVTVLGKTRSLEKPFVVLATQNPIDQEGTYDLPEAQADRFMFKALMPVPGSHTILKIMNKRSGVIAKKISDDQPNNDDSVRLKNTMFSNAQKEPKEIFNKIYENIQKVEPSEIIEQHIINMFLASNQKFDELQGIETSNLNTLKQIVEELMTIGLSPRAAIDLMLATKAWSLLFFGSSATDPRALANVVIPTLRHRIKLDMDWEYRYRQIIRDKIQSNLGLHEDLLANFCMLSAPSEKFTKYPKEFKHILLNEGQ